MQSILPLEKLEVKPS